MAHDINFNEAKGTHSFASAKQKAWHGLGQVVEEKMTTKEALELANLDYVVEKVPNYVHNGKKFMPNGSFSTRRADTKEIFGNTLGSGYTVLQNTEAFEFFDHIVGESESIIETAGALGKGERVFITAKMPDFIEVAKVDRVENYLMVMNDHAGRASITVMFTPVRVVCNNTLNLALKGVKNKVRIRHTKNANLHLKMAKEILGIQNFYQQELDSAFKHLTKKKMSAAEFDTFVFGLIANEKQKKEYSDGASIENALKKSKFSMFNDIKQYNLEGIGQDMKTVRGTAFGAFNAVTGYFQNMKEYKSDEIKMKNIIMGTDKKIAQKAFNQLLYTS